MQVYVCTMYMFDGHRGQKRTLDRLKLELQTVVRCHLGAGK